MYRNICVYVEKQTVKLIIAAIDENYIPAQLEFILLVDFSVYFVCVCDLQRYVFVYIYVFALCLALEIRIR